MSRFSVVMVMFCFFTLLSAMDYEPINHYEKAGGTKGDSLNVRFVGNWPFGPSWAVAYDSARSLVFCASGGGVYILDVSDPSSPFRISTRIRTRGSVWGLFYDYSSERLYIADYNAGLEIWDVSVPDLPIKLGHYDTPDDTRDVVVSGSYAYVADGGAGLRVIDITNPSNPVEVGYYDTPGLAEDVVVSGSYAYVADWYSGLHVIDITNPSNPVEVGYYDTPGWPEDVVVSGSYAYVTNRFSGLQIYENLLIGVEESQDVVSIPRFRLLQNPVTGDYIELGLSHKQEGRYDIGLYNLLGQKVKTFSISGLSAGEYKIRLQTKTLSGGVYFMRIKGKKTEQFIKVTIIK